MLAAESAELRTWFSCRKINSIALRYWRKLADNGEDKPQYATEQALSVSDELVLQNLGSVLRKGLDDHALLNAIMLTFVFTSTASIIDRDYLRYQVEALGSIRQRMSSPDKATTEPTLGAIVLLAGIEVGILLFIFWPLDIFIKQATPKADITIVLYRLGSECPVKFNFIWGQYISFLKFVEKRGYI
jgi:hypothetical protein